MRLANMKLRLVTTFLLLLTLYFANSEKQQDGATQGDNVDDEQREQMKESDSQLSAVSGPAEDPDTSNQIIMKKLQRLPTDKLKNILKIINKQTELQQFNSADSENENIGNDNDKNGQNMVNEVSPLNSRILPEKLSFHRGGRLQELPGKLIRLQEFGNEDNKEEDVAVHALKISQEKTKTGSLRQLKRLEPVTNVLIHSFEGDAEEEADKEIGAGLRGASRSENIARFDADKGVERGSDAGSNDVFAGAEEKLGQGKESLLEAPDSRMKLARLIPRLERKDGDADAVSSKQKTTKVDNELVSLHGNGKSDEATRILSPRPEGEASQYLKPIKLRPLQNKNIGSERLPVKIMQEINEAMIERVKDSGDKRTAKESQLGDSQNDSSPNRAATGITTNSQLSNDTEGQTDKRVTSKSQFAFSYDPDSPIGPEMWKVLHTDWTCQGRKQSPINIKSENVANDTTCKNIGIRVEPDGRAITGILRNNGHAPTFSLTNSATVRLMGATLPNDYFLKQLHFHFGCENSRGSEHKIDGQSYPLELHLVFWDKKTFETFAEAAKSDRGIAVVAVLFQRSFVPVSQIRNTPVTQLLQVLKKIPNEVALRICDGQFAYGKICANFSTLRKPSKLRPDFRNFQEIIWDFVQISEIFDFRLEKLIPNVMNTLQADRFFTYEGSLTTPGCYESVTWIVLNSHPVITDDQLEMLRKLKSAKVNSEGTMCDNFRPIQKSYGRRIYSNII